MARGTSGNADVALAATGVDSPPGESSGTDEPTDREINLSTIFDLESIGCVDCGSLLSPAAYYVYLLEELDKIKWGKKSISTGQADGAKSGSGHIGALVLEHQDPHSVH